MLSRYILLALSSSAAGWPSKEWRWLVDIIWQLSAVAKGENSLLISQPLGTCLWLQRSMTRVGITAEAKAVGLHFRLDVAGSKVVLYPKYNNQLMTTSGSSIYLSIVQPTCRCPSDTCLITTLFKLLCQLLSESFGSLLVSAYSLPRTADPRRG